MTEHPLYMTWRHMIDRCYVPTDHKYYMYGARGITVCERWRNDFYTFVEDMGERPIGHTLDRIKGWLGYTPTNCRWATAITQSWNRTFSNPNLYISTARGGYRVRVTLKAYAKPFCKFFKTLFEAEEFRDELVYEREFHRALGLQ